MTPASNLPPLSMTPAANFSTSFASVVDTGINNTGGKQWEQLSNCWQLMNLKKKNYLYANSSTQRCPKNNENFSDWRFFPFATGVDDTGGAP
jgi:hypothetical protein